MQEYVREWRRVARKIKEDHVGAYAAQAAFFMMLSLVPMMMLLMALVRYTPVTQSDIMVIVSDVFPRTIRSAMIALVDEVYHQTGTVISLTMVVAFWSAGRGVLAITRGLNLVKGSRETRNYFLLRLRAAAYTVVFLVAIITTLVLLGFGNGISFFLREHLPVVQYVLDLVMEFRTIAALGILSIVTLFIYQFLPIESRKMRDQIPGAVFTACGWVFASFLFSIYMDIFRGFSNIYGSLTTIALIMLWLYFCMYVILLGAEINDLLEERLDKGDESE